MDDGTKKIINLLSIQDKMNHGEKISGCPQLGPYKI